MLDLSIKCIPYTLMGPLFYNVCPISGKDVGNVFGFTAQKTGENKSFFGKKSSVINQQAHDIIMDVGYHQIRRIGDQVLSPGLDRYDTFLQVVESDIAGGCFGCQQV